MRLYVHKWLIDLEYRFGYLRLFCYRSWLSRLVDASCPTPEGEPCPVLEPEG